jgi:molybdopterin synthase catalytic subunit
VQPPLDGPDWLAVTDAPLPVAAAYEWSVTPACGAVVLFSGTVRDHAVDDGGQLRSGVSTLTYEAYDERVVPTFAAIVAELRRRVPSVGRVAILHRTGVLQLGESSVLVVVSAAHRPDAFEAARYGIDAVKASAPIWKREEWQSGSDWGTGAHAPMAPVDVPSVGYER